LGAKDIEEETKKKKEEERNIPPASLTHLKIPPEI
jgi:hypothetical protein